MHDAQELADRAADAAISPPELLAKGYRDYWRYRLTLRGGGAASAQTRDVLMAGKVVLLLLVDLTRDEIVLIRQFRLPAHLANGRGAMTETVAGRVEPSESLIDAARRECAEEIGVAPSKLVELFSFLTSPGITDEEVTVFLVAIDAARVPEGVLNTAEGERIETVRVSIDAALAVLAEGTVRNGPLVVVLQWLALNRGRVAELLSSAR